VPVIVPIEDNVSPGGSDAVPVAKDHSNDGAPPADS
jgi:hypothetical protein